MACNGSSIDSIRPIAAINAAYRGDQIRIRKPRLSALISYRFQFSALIFGVLLGRADTNVKCNALHDDLPAEITYAIRPSVFRIDKSEKIDSDFAGLIWIGHTRVFGIGTTLQISHGQQLQRAELGPCRASLRCPHCP